MHLQASSDNSAPTIDIKEPLIIEKPKSELEISRIKPGYKTTEFYKSLFLEVVALATAFGYIRPEDSDILNQLPDGIAAISGELFRIAGLITALISQWGYTKSRAQVKRQK